MINQTNLETENSKGLQVVIGLGLSGLSAVQYLTEQGYKVAVTDANPNPSLASKLPKNITSHSFGNIDQALLLKAARIIISPGISLKQPAVAAALQAGISVICDIQLFQEELRKKDKHTDKEPTRVIAITGSNAKSTVTTLVGQMAEDAGVNVGIGGNIGVPALNLLQNDDMSLVVLELSSFQLETVSNLNADVVTVLNMSPDHLDRHGDMQQYQEAKHRIFQGAKSIVINRNDQTTLPTSLIDNKLSIGTDSPAFNQFGLITDTDGKIFLAKGQHKLIDTNELKIKGQHNQLNALHALAIGELAGLPMTSMIRTLQNFAGLPHRCQFISSINGVDYFNDSKGTNMGSTMAAIKGLGESYTSTNPQAKLSLILGGQGKGQDFSDMCELINEFVGEILFIGEDAHLIEQQLTNKGLQDTINLTQAQTLSEAIDTIQLNHGTNPNINIKAVLLSPACASFDQYTGYVARGEDFVKLVTHLSK